MLHQAKEIVSRLFYYERCILCSVIVGGREVTSKIMQSSTDLDESARFFEDSVDIAA